VHQLKVLFLICVLISGLHLLLVKLSTDLLRQLLLDKLQLMKRCLPDLDIVL
jgi:hypothetical protein